MVDFEKIIILNDVVIAIGKNTSLIKRWIKIEIEEHGDTAQLTVYYTPDYTATFTTKNLFVKVK